MNLSSNVPASATGRLDALPLCELLAYALYKKLDGCFVFDTPPHEQGVLQISHGYVTKARTAAGGPLLGTLLLEAGALSQAALGRTLALATAQRARLGSALLERADVPQAMLDAVLREQLARRVAALARLPDETTFAFYSGVDALPEVPSITTDPLALIARSLRAAPPPQRVERVLARVRGYKIKLPPGTELGRLELSKEEHAFATRLKQGGLPIPFDAPEADPPPEIARLLYLLVLTRQLQIEGKSPMRTSPPPRHSGTLRRPTPAPASASAAEAATSSWASRAPSSLPGAAVSEAPPASAPPSRQAAIAVLRAAQECVKRHQLDRAQALADRAEHLLGAPVEARALKAWIDAQRVDRHSARLAQDLLARLNQCIREEPNNPRIRFYRGQVLKRFGRSEDALRDFRFSARQDPDNLDAFRELRVHHMRSEPPPSRASGVFARLFGR